MKRKSLLILWSLQALVFLIALAALHRSIFTARAAGPVFASLPLPFEDVSGISYDGSSLWITVEGRQTIYQVDARTNQVQGKIPFFEKATAGSAWDGRSLWQLAWVSKKLYQIDLKTGSILRAFPSPGKGACSGMTFDGRHLWVANFEDGKIYRIDQEKGGRIIQAIDSDFETTGLAWDGSYLWRGILVGTKTHDEVTPYTGFVEQRDLAAGKTLMVLPINGVGPGTSDWIPGSGRAGLFWWYDGFHKRIVRVEIPTGGAPSRNLLVLLAGLSLLPGVLIWKSGGSGR